MIVRTLEQIRGSEHDVEAPHWRSRRLLLAADGMGFSLHDTIIHAGTETEICYLHHLEAVYCIAGRGEIELLPDGPRFPIETGTLYALDGHERHLLRATTELRMVCVFNPALHGQEVHDENGAYPAPPTPEER